MPQKFANNAQSVLVSGITAVATSLTIETLKADLFPEATTTTWVTPLDFYKLVLSDGVNREVVRVGIRAFNSPVMSNILRAQDGTTARAFPNGATVICGFVARDVDDINVTLGAQGTQIVANASAITAAAASLAASGGTALVGGTWFGGVIATVAALATSVGASLLGSIQAGAGAVLRSIQSKLRERVTPADFGAVGDGVTDDTVNIKAMLTSGAKIFDLLDRDYVINIAEGTALATFTAQRGIQIRGTGRLLDSRTYAAGSLTQMFVFDACRDCSVDLNYQGLPITDKSNATTGIGYRGATFVQIKNGCRNITVNGRLEYLRYGVLSGSYTIVTEGYNRTIKTVLQTFECGYPIAYYLAEDIDAVISAESSHRSAYLAGVKGGRVVSRFKNQYIAPSQVLITDALTGTGTSRGCSGLDVMAMDMGSTIFTANSWAVALSPSRADPGTVYEDINVHFHVIGTDTVAPTLGGFALYSNVISEQPSYPFNWEPTMLLKGIKVSGLVDRSAQTIATHGTGEVYINSLDSTVHFATVTGLDLDGVQTLNGSGSNPREIYCINPGLTDQVNVRGCNFGNYLLQFKSNPTAPINFIGCAPIPRSSTDSTDTSAINFVNTKVTALLQPMTNTTFNNSKYMGAGVEFRSRVIDLALTGASTTWVNSLSNNSLILSVTGYVTVAITGTTGFNVGTGAAATRFFTTNTLAVGTAFTPSNGTDTAPQFQVGTGSIIVAAKTATFTGGTIRLSVNYLLLTAPTP